MIVCNGSFVMDHSRWIIRDRSVAIKGSIAIKRSFRWIVGNGWIFCNGLLAMDWLFTMDRSRWIVCNGLFAIKGLIVIKRSFRWIQSFAMKRSFWWKQALAMKWVLAMKGLDNEICKEMLWLLLGCDWGGVGLIKGIYLEWVVVRVVCTT